MRANKDEPINRLRTSRSSNKRGHRQLLAALVLGGILESGDEQVLQSRGILSVPGIMVQRETHDAYTNPRIYSTIGYLDQATSPNIGVNFETVRNNYGEVGSTVQLRSVLPAQTFARLYRAFDTTNPEVQAMLANNRYFYLPNPPPTRARYIRGDNSGYDTVIVSSNALPFEALIRERLALASVGENGLTASDSILVDDLRHELLHDAWHHLLSSQDKEKFVHIMDQLFELQPECDALGRPLVLAYYLNNPSVAASHVGLPSGVFLGDSRWQPTYRRAVELIFSDVVSEFARNYSPQDATIRQHVTDLLLWYTRFRINMEQRFVTYTHLNRSSFMSQESYASVESDGEDIVPFRRFYQGVLNPRDLPTESRDRALTIPHEFDGPNPYMESEDSFVRSAIPVIQQFISFLTENKTRFHIQ